MHVPCPAHFILLDLFTVIMRSNVYKSQSSSLCNFMQPGLTSSLLGPTLLTASKKCYALHQNTSNESNEG